MKDGIDGCDLDSNDEVLQFIRNENPFNRVQRLYKINDDNTEYYMESKVCRNVSFIVSTFVGTIAFRLAAPLCMENYIAANVTTVYQTRWLANRKAKDAYMLGGLRRFGKWTVITYMAVASVSYLSQALELYRCKTSTAHYAGSGALVGGLSRLILGPKAMLAGSLMGGYFGMVVGFVVTQGMSYAGINIEKRYYEEVKKKLDAERYFEQYGAEMAARLAAEESQTPCNTTEKLEIKPTLGDTQKAGTPV